jgi:hypothetical protein
MTVRRAFNADYRMGSRHCNRADNNPGNPPSGWGGGRS